VSSVPGAASSERPVRIMLAARAGSRLRALPDYLESDTEPGDPQLRVVEHCTEYEQVLGAVTRSAPDLIAIELELLGSDPGEIGRHVRALGPTRVAVLGASRQQRSEPALAALAAGAVAVLPASAIDFDAPSSAWARSFRIQFKRLAVTGSPTRLVEAVAGAGVTVPEDACPVIGVCASTGGPKALETVLGRLPVDFPIPVLVVQHMTPRFTAGLVTSLDAMVRVPVALARGGHPLEAGVWIAPSGCHLTLGPDRHLVLDRRPAVSGHRPSGDRLLRSLASVAGAHAVAVVLTGMGRDGAAGLAAVAATGGRTLTQDEASSAVYGMPRAAAQLGAAQILSLPAIGDELARLASRRARTAIGTEPPVAPQ
jgi:two-component system chemotaxis response regulator CheB